MQEFEFEVKDSNRNENQVADHLSRLEDEAMRELGEKSKINDTFLDEEVLALLMTSFHGYPISQIF